MSAQSLPRRPWPKILIACLILIVVALAGVHGVAWYVVTGRMEAGFTDYASAAAADGWRIEAGQVRRTGWPWRATVRLGDIQATRELGGTRLRWRADRLLLTISPRTPGILLIAPGGAQTVELGSKPPIRIEARTMLLRAALAGDQPLAWTAEALSIGTGYVRLQVERADAQVTPVAVAGAASGIVLAPPLAAPFNGGAELAFRAVVNQPFPIAASPAQSAAQWQAAKGRAELPEFTLKLGPLMATGSATGELDPHLQPALRATLRVQGAIEVLDAVGAAGLVEPGPASAIRAVLSLLALAAGGGPVTLPVVLEDGTLTVARFPLLRLPVLDWNAP